MNYRIYGKFKNDKTFKAMDIKEGYQVNNLIYATLFTKNEATRVFKHISRDNNDWKFEIREVS